MDMKIDFCSQCPHTWAQLLTFLHSDFATLARLETGFGKTKLSVIKRRLDRSVQKHVALEYLE